MLMLQAKNEIIYEKCLMLCQNTVKHTINMTFPPSCCSNYYFSTRYRGMSHPKLCTYSTVTHYIFFSPFQITSSHFSMAWWQHKNMCCPKFDDFLGIRLWAEYLTIILFSVIAQKLHWVHDCNVTTFYQFLPVSLLFNIWLLKFLARSLLFWVVCIHRSVAASPPLGALCCHCLTVYYPIA